MMLPYMDYQDIIEEIRELKEKFEEAPRLTPTKERELLAKWQNEKDVSARNELLASHMRMLPHRAGRYTLLYGIPLHDLIAEGTEGIIEAANRYDLEERKVRFHFNALTYIVTRMRSFTQENLSVWPKEKKTPFRKLADKFPAEMQTAYEENKHDLSDKEVIDIIAEKHELDPIQVQELCLLLSGRDVELDQPVPEAKDDSVKVRNTLLHKDGLTPEEHYISMESSAEVMDLISEFYDTLTEREQTIFNDRIKNDKHVTLETMSKKIGITAPGVKRIEEKILRKLKEWFEDHNDRRKEIEKITSEHFRDIPENTL